MVFLQNDGDPVEPDQPGSTGWELAFEPQPSDAVVRKRHDNGFAETDLDAVLRNHHVKKISICGVMSEMCVAATAGQRWSEATRWSSRTTLTGLTASRLGERRA